MAWLKKKVQGHIDSFRSERKSGSSDKVNIEIKVQGPDDDLHLSDLESSISSSQGDFRQLIKQQQLEEEEAKAKNGKSKVKTHRRGRSDGSIIIKNKRKDTSSMVLLSDNLQRQVKGDSSHSVEYKGSVGEIAKEFTNVSFMNELNKEAEESITKNMAAWKQHKSTIDQTYHDMQEKIDERRVLLITLVTEYANDMHNRLTKKYTEQQHMAEKVIATLDSLQNQEDDEIKDMTQTLDKLPTLPQSPLPELTHNTKDNLKLAIPQIFGTFQTLKSKSSVSSFETYVSTQMNPNGNISTSSSVSSPSASCDINTLMTRPEYIGSISAKSSKDIRECGLTDMAFTKNQQIIVVDKHNKLVKVFDTNGTLVKFIGKNVLKEPSRVTVLPWNDQILVSDSAAQVIVIFNTDGAVIGNFAEDLSSPVANCTMPDNKIAVVNFDTKLVTTYTEDVQGEYKKCGSFPTGLDCPAYITCTQTGHLVISDWSANKLRIYDTQGKFIKQVSKTGSGQGQINKPQGVHGDCHGNLFLGEKGNRRIQIFNEEGESTFIMDKKTYDLNLPMSMDTTSDGFLIIAEYQGNIKFFRYLDVPIIDQITVRPLTAKKGRGTASVSPETFFSIEESDL